MNFLNKKMLWIQLHSIDMENRLKKGLGRGLSSLLGDTVKKVETNKISIQDLTRNKFQPRKHFAKESLEELTDSIKEQGVIQPIVVRPNKILKVSMKLLLENEDG